MEALRLSFSGLLDIMTANRMVMEELKTAFMEGSEQMHRISEQTDENFKTLGAQVRLLPCLELTRQANERVAGCRDPQRPIEGHVRPGLLEDQGQLRSG